MAWDLFWSAIGSIFTVLGFFLAIFIEWEKVKGGITKLVPQSKTARTLTLILLFTFTPCGLGICAFWGVSQVIASLPVIRVTRTPTITTNASSTATARPTSFPGSRETSTQDSLTDLPTSFTPSPTYTQVLPSQTPEIKIIFNTDQKHQTTVKGFSFTVTQIELRPNNKMRWYFEFWNQTEEEVLLGLDHEKIYLADEFGNKYTVRDASSYPDVAYRQAVPAGVLYKHWMDFETPINNARKFTVGLFSVNQYWDANYGLFEIDLAYDTSLTPLPPTPTLASNIVFYNGERHQTTVRGFSFTVTQIELRPNNKMRWYFEFWNQTEEEVLLGLDHEKIYLADEFGNKYTVRDASSYPEVAYRQTIPAGVLYKHWMDFEAPINNARKFTVGLLPVNQYWDAGYNEFIVTFTR